MVLEDTQYAPARTGGLTRHRAIPLLFAVALVLGAAGIRLYAIDEPPLEFHASRQYRSLIIARAAFFESSPGIPVWQRAVAATSRDRQGVLEPPVLESVVATAYQVLRSEVIWLPRLLSSVLWLIGTAFVYRIAGRIAGPAGAIFAIAFYLFLPFAVVASRSVQPDPPMVVLVLASIWAIDRFDDQPSGRRLALAAALSAAAFVVLPRSVPVVLAVYAALAVNRHGLMNSLRSRDAWLFAALSFGLAAIAYGYLVLSGTFRLDVAQGIVLPQLLITPFFWRGWLAQIDATVGLAAFAAALIGTLVVADTRSRALLIGLWVGYLLFGLVFNYAIATHDYYHLQLVPIVALSLAPLVALVTARVGAIHESLLVRAMPWAILVGAITMAVLVTRGRLAIPDLDEQVAAKEEIGALVGHSTRSVFLSGDYGTPLEYHGLLSGRPWPLSADLEWERLAGVPTPAAADRFRDVFAGEVPEYFIVEDFIELELQPDLARLLAGCPVVGRTERYLVVDLRQTTTSCALRAETGGRS